ncbi:Elongator complex protein 4 [Stachybotrys elegans]|uniref:Elongator complex protein 4 n=1 Tax=Stachybotrys elegans TaxID=80388 RepID=A0A8K0T4E4_9HYPO|nr:Elongator complex protein 4 [Stachybotrys elegans]
MSFRKRNVVIGAPSPSSSQALRQDKSPAPGTRPSPLDGRITTSTGTLSFDQLLAGHAGLPMGSSVLVEEAGTTDFGGILLRYYAAEGLVQGHDVHILGYDDSWRRELPGLVAAPEPKIQKSDQAADDRMKIAWRYESLGNKSPQPRGPSTSTSSSQFCHSFDLTKRLEHSAMKGQLHVCPSSDPLSARSAPSVFKRFLSDLSSKLARSPTSVHRIVIPNLLSPTVYASTACRPQEVLQFLHGLRGLLRQFSTRTTALITLPISLHPRSSGLVRWIELLSDGVLELVPLQHQNKIARDLPGEDKTQGLLRTHSLPGFQEKGGGLDGLWMRDDLSFRLSSSNGLVITPFTLPPVGEDENPDKGSKAGEGKNQSLEF